MSNSGDVYGPSALGGDKNRLWRLTSMLAVTEFKLTFFGSALGYVWSLMRPLLFFGVLYVMFTQVIRFGEDVRHYPVYLLTSIVLFSFFAEVTSTCVQSLVIRENLLRKIRFPYLVVPMSVTLTALFNLGMNLIAVVVFALCNGVTPTLTWLMIPLLLLLLLAFAMGIGLFLSALYVRFRDVKPIWDVVSQILFYGSPVLYVASQYPDSARELAMLNPIAVVLTQMRHDFLDSTAPTAAAVIGGSALLLIPVGIVLALLVGGLAYFNHEVPRIAENL